jgi:hypothetical protein
MRAFPVRLPSSVRYWTVVDDEYVPRRANPNGAWAKSRRARAVPVDELLVLAYDSY